MGRDDHINLIWKFASVLIRVYIKIHLSIYVSFLVRCHTIFIAGGKRRSAYFYDLWNIKYLKKFKWDNLTEEIGKRNASFHVIFWMDWVLMISYLMQPIEMLSENKNKQPIYQLQKENVIFISLKSTNQKLLQLWKSVKTRLHFQWKFCHSSSYGI